MEELFNALLDISRLDAGVVHPHITTIPRAAVFHKVRFEYGPIARRKRLGLGLAIVQRLARLLGYRVELHSTVGKGSMCSISVPRGRKEDFRHSRPVGYRGYGSRPVAGCASQRRAHSPQATQSRPRTLIANLLREPTRAA